MRETSALYKTILADWGHGEELKAVVSGTEYLQNRLFGCAIGGNAFVKDELATGSTVAREVRLVLLPVGVVPRMAEIKLYKRLTLGNQASEWFPVGVFYTDTRDKDAAGLMTIHGYDAMLKGSEIWLDPTLDAGQWPMTGTAAVANMARRMGTTVDPRTKINPACRVDYPNDLTMREALSIIALQHKSNFVMTEEGKLLLLPAGKVPAETSLLVSGEGGGAILFGSVRLIV